jgi:predicted Holliday junction resolvase-like endonuclease
LLGKDRSKGEHSNWLHSKLNLFIDIVARRHYKNYSLPIVLILLVLLYPLITSALEQQDKLELQALELQKLEQQLNDKRLAWQKLEEQHTGDLQKLQNEGKIKQSETKVRIRGCIQNKRNQTRQDFLKCVK